MEKSDDINRRLSKAARWVGVIFVLLILAVFVGGIWMIYSALHPEPILHSTGTDIESVQQYFPHLTGIQLAKWKDQTVSTDNLFDSRVRQFSGAVRLDPQGAAKLLRQGEWEPVDLEERNLHESPKHFLTPDRHQWLIYRGAYRDLLKNGARGRLYFEKRSRVLVFNISPISD